MERNHQWHGHISLPQQPPSSPPNTPVPTLASSSFCSHPPWDPSPHSHSQEGSDPTQASREKPHLPGSTPPAPRHLPPGSPYPCLLSPVPSFTKYREVSVTCQGGLALHTPQRPSSGPSDQQPRPHPNRLLQGLTCTSSTGWCKSPVDCSTLTGYQRMEGKRWGTREEPSTNVSLPSTQATCARGPARPPCMPAGLTGGGAQHQPLLSFGQLCEQAAVPWVGGILQRMGWEGALHSPLPNTHSCAWS